MDQPTRHLPRRTFLTAAAVTTAAVAVATTTGISPAQAAPLSNWTELPGGGASPDAPAPVAYNGIEYVFVHGTDNKIYVDLNNGVSWSGWRTVPGNGATTF